MMRKVSTVRPLVGYTLEVVFDNGELRIFDVTPYLDKGIFKALADESYFKRVAVKFDGVAWPGQQDFSPDTLYLKGVARAEAA